MFGASTSQSVPVLAESLREVVASFDPDAVPLDEAPALWQAFNEIERLAAAAQLLVADRVAGSPVWQDAGCRSAAEYLARSSGCTVRSARDQLRASKRLASLPAVSRALRRAELSVTQAQLIADAATADPTKEQDLVDLAGRASLADLAQECGRIKAAADPDPDRSYRRIHENRRLRQHTDTDGAWCLYGRGTPDAGALFNHTLAPIIDEMFDKARAEGRREHRDAYCFDAFVELLRRSVERDHDKTEPVEDTGPAHDSTDQRPAHDQRTSPTERRKRTNPRYLGLLRIDLEALVRGKVEGEELCEITGLGPIPVNIARGLLGDSILKLVITKGVDVARVTHLGRGPTAAQRVALLWTTPGCSNEACSHSYVQIDHRTEWAKTHHTRLPELDHLCPHDHWLKTHHGWSLIEGTGKRAFVPPTDTRHPNLPGRRKPVAA